MVAMNQAQYGDLGAVSPWCFQTITISYGKSLLFSLSFVPLSLTFKVTFYQVVRLLKHKY